MQRILVTGGAGFIGSHTVDHLLAKGYEVLVLDNYSTVADATHLGNHPRLTIQKGDVLDFPLLQSLLAECDAVLHLAALPSVQESIDNPIRTSQVNTLGFLHVLQAVRTLNKKIRIVYASSAAVYGNASHLPCCDERCDDIPLSPYALEKANNERYAELFFNLFGIRSLGLRYFNVYGSRQNPHSVYSGVITKFMDHYKKKKTITIFGDGNQSRDFIHVSDVVRANALALQSDYHGVVNIATGKAESLLHLIQYMENAFGYAIPIDFTAARVGDIVKSYAATQKAKNHLEFTYQTELANGIASLVE